MRLLAVIKLIIFSIIFSFKVSASSCLLTEALKDDNLSKNTKFWEEYSLLLEKGVNSDEAIKQARKKFVNAPVNTPVVNKSISVSTPVRRLEYNKRARSELKGLPKNLKTKVDEFIEIALQPRGFAEIRNNPGRWHWEKIPQFGPNAQSIRLNGGYRVLFDLKDDELIIREINKGHIHGS